MRKERIQANLMKYMRYILGGLAIVAAVLCFVNPLFTVRFIGWALTVILGISGITMIANYIANKRANRAEVGAGAVTLLFGILIAVFSLLAILFPAVEAYLRVFLIVMFSINLFLTGVNMLIISFTGYGMLPFLTGLLGILLIIGGANGFIHLVNGAITMNIFFGIGLLVYGISLLCGTSEGPKFYQQTENRDGGRADAHAGARTDTKTENAGAKVILICPNCQKKLRLPSGKGRVRITCPACRHEFEQTI